MLTELHIEDLGVIANLDLVLGRGLTALTGETGAGKTMLVEAINLLVGGRADPTIVRPGKAEARVEDARSQQHRKQAGGLLRAAGGLLSSFLGGRKSSRALARTIGSAAGSMVGGGSASLDTAERAVEDKQNDLARIEADLASQLIALDEQWDGVARQVETIQIGLEASDISVSQLALVWLPTKG